MRKKENSTIALELERFENKIKQFQDYLEVNDILCMPDETKRYKELEAQEKIMDRLPVWLEGLKKLREENKDKPKELRGGVEMNDAAILMMERNK